MKNLFSVMPDLVSVSFAHTNFLQNLIGEEIANPADIVHYLKQVPHSFLLPVKIGAILNDAPFCFSGAILGVYKKEIEAGKGEKNVFTFKIAAPDGTFLIGELILPQNLNTLYDEKGKALPTIGDAFYFQYNGKQQSSENKGKQYNDCFLLH